MQKFRVKNDVDVCCIPIKRLYVCMDILCPIRETYWTCFKIETYWTNPHNNIYTPSLSLND